METVNLHRSHVIPEKLLPFLLYFLPANRFNDTRRFHFVAVLLIKFTKYKIRKERNQGTQARRPTVMSRYLSFQIASPLELSFQIYLLRLLRSMNRFKNEKGHYRY